MSLGSLNQTEIRDFSKVPIEDDEGQYDIETIYTSPNSDSISILFDGAADPLDKRIYNALSRGGFHYISSLIKLLMEHNAYGELLSKVRNIGETSLKRLLEILITKKLIAPRQIKNPELIEIVRTIEP